MPRPLTLAALTLPLGLAAASPVHAQETLDVGVLRDTDIEVVQKLLYPKTDALELGGAVGWMPFDTYTTTPMLSLRVAKHFSENLGVEAEVSGGYGLKSYSYKQLEGPAYGIRPDAYRYLGGAFVGVQWSPIYAKMNWRGDKIFHHDVYTIAGLAGSYETALMPDRTAALSPGVGLGLGLRIFMQNGDALRVQIRDDVMMQYRDKTADAQGWFVKQNVSLTVGYSKLKRSN